MNEDRLREKPKESWYYFGLVGTIGYTIALPIAGGALIGSYIDHRWLLYPKATLSLIFLGVVLSIFGLARTIGDIMHRKNSYK